MKQLFENWRRYQLNEIFTSPVPKEEIIFKRDGPNFEWAFKVGEHEYDIDIGWMGRHAAQDLTKKIYVIEFGVKKDEDFIDYEPTNYGPKTGMKVMSTVIAITEEWIKNNEFFKIFATSVGGNRSKVYNRILRNFKKKNSDYEIESREAQRQYGVETTLSLINVGAVEREINRLVQDGDSSVTELVSDALGHLNDGPAKERIIRATAVACLDDLS